MNIPPLPELQRIQLNFDTRINPPEAYYLADSCIETITQMLADKDFEARYIPKFKWFMDHERPHNVLNFGCGRRETFALLWYLGADAAVGVDSDSGKIDVAKRLVDTIKALVTKHIPKLRAEIDNIISETIPRLISDRQIDNADSGRLFDIYNQFLQEFERWQKENIPENIGKQRLPMFERLDISQGLALQDRFDLIYGRCILYISDKAGSDVSAMVHNIANVVRPETGRVVVVEPSYFEEEKYDFVPLFLDAGLKLMSEVTNDVELGGNEINECKGEGFSALKGNIFYKPSKE